MIIMYYSLLWLYIISLIPVTGEIQRPSLVLEQSSVYLEDCYIGVPHTRSITIINRGLLPTQYEWIRDTVSDIDEYVCTVWCGIITPAGAHEKNYLFFVWHALCYLNVHACTSIHVALCNLVFSNHSSMIIVNWTIHRARDWLVPREGPPLI